MDQSKYSVLLISLEASSEEGEYITNAGYSIVYDGHVFRNEQALEVRLPEISGDLGTSECKIAGVRTEGVFFGHLSNNYPFSKVRVIIKELDRDIDTDAFVAERVLFDGLVYQSAPIPLKGYMEIICREWKYYTDIVAGVPCTEMCSWSYLGGRGCGVAPVLEVHTVESVSGLNLTIVDSLSDTRDFLFNKGYIEYLGGRIKIKYHQTGKTLQMDKAPPSSWIGKEVNVFSGCDRQLKTCRTIYNNESNFLGLGIAMVDYNPFYESP